MKEDTKKLLRLFNKKEKKMLIMLFIMMIVAAFFETVGIGLIIPFVGMITSPEIIHKQAILSYLYKMFHFQSNLSFLVFSVLVLLTVFLFKNIYLLFFHHIQYKVILNQQVKLSRRLFAEYLTKSYIFHLQQNTANLLRNVNGEVPKVFQGIIISTFQLFTEILVSTCILLLLLKTAPFITLVATVLLGGGVFLFFKFFRKKMTFLGKEHQKVGGGMIKWVNQGLGASKEVKVSGKENFFIDAYTRLSQINVNINRYMKMLDQAPRLFIETMIVSIVLISMLIIIFQQKSTTELVSILALFAMAAFRIMPSITRIVSLVATIRYNQPALSVVYNDLFMDKEEPFMEVYTTSQESFKNMSGEKTFKDTIKLTDVSFRYPNQEEYSIKDVSLSIPIGKSVAFIGESGAGKSTIVDIILGLFQPEKGKILVDGKNLTELKKQWQNKIGYIPQTIFLSDDSIRANVAFAVRNEEIDENEVWRALEQAQLKEFVESLPDKLDTQVGERGVRLSGGQRQRIGIARALYHNPEILFMDEATSALDNETEKEIMRAIDGLRGDKTLIIIAHRLSTIENCDIVFKINKGRLIAVENKIARSVM